MAVLKVRKGLVKKSFTQYTNTLSEMNYNRIRESRKNKTQTKTFLGTQARSGFKQIFHFYKER